MGIFKIRKLLHSVVLLCLAAILFTAGLTLYTWYAPLTMGARAESIKVPFRSNIHAVASELAARNLLRYPKLLVLAMRCRGFADDIHFGEYVITPNMSVRRLMMHMVNQTGWVQHKIVFIEGWTFHRLLRCIESDYNLRHFLEGDSDAKIMHQLGFNFKHPEGLFFPDTYHFYWGNTDIALLQRSYEKMQSVLADAWAHRQSHLPYKNSYQALIVASLVEAETPLKRERPIIAGIIINRLKKGMQLQIDPTVMYGLNEPYGSHLSRKDLEKDTPYNTYMHYGLPPTPIDMPSVASINAALHPTKTVYYYFVAKGDGSHKFSKTYQQQVHAVDRYLKRNLKKKKRRS